MATKLYVGGLPYSTTEDALKAHFAQVATVVSATIIQDKMSGRSRGFGFVEIESADDAKKAIEAFDGKDFEGRKLIVNEARPQEERPRRSFGGGGGGDRGGGGGGYGGGGGGYGGGGSRGGGGGGGGGRRFGREEY